MSERTMGAKAVVAAVVLQLAFCQTAGAQTHAPWPADWNNWNDSALWCTVGDPGNTGELAGSGVPGGQGSARVCGAVSYTYQISRFEVTAGQYTAFLNSVAATDTYALYNIYMDVANNVHGCGITRAGTPGAYTYSVAPDRAERPVSSVSWGDAARFANWLSNGRPSGGQGSSTTENGVYDLHGATTDNALLGVGVPSAATRASWAGGSTPRWVLPTEDEWYKAAYYKGGSANAGYWDYPTCSDIPPSNILSDPDPGNSANVMVLNQYTIGAPYYRTVAGEFENSAGPYGTFDQGGNTWEWNEGLTSGQYRICRGGSFDYLGYVFTMHAAYRSGYLPHFDGYDMGFRLVLLPEPTTLALMAMGGLVVLRKVRE